MKNNIFKKIFSLLIKDKLAFIGLVIIFLILIMGLFVPYLAPHDPYKVNFNKQLLPPGREFPLGTDQLGRCILSRIIYGIRVSLGTAFIVLIISMSISIIAGTLAGYSGGYVDKLFSGIIDILLAIPSLVFALAIAGILGPGLKNIIIALVVIHWVTYARIIRGMVLSIREKDYVLAAKACGGSDLRIIFKHIVPNIISPVIVLGTLDIGNIILKISGLSFLGLGAQPPTAEWGAMLSTGSTYFQLAYWLMIFPGGAILITVLAFNFLGDGLRDIFDPKEFNK